MPSLPRNIRRGAIVSSSAIAWPWSFDRPGNRCFEISVDAWTVMVRFRQTALHLAEAGGVLLGRHLRDESAIIVDAITTPLPGDQRARTRFYRAQRQHQAVIDEAWRTSKGTCTYLGEWHTHPEPIPIPSAVDRADWKRRLRTDRYSDPLFFVIIGTEQVAAWEGRRNGMLIPLALVKR